MMVGAMATAFAQYPTVTIRQIQEVDSASLAMNMDASPLLGDTVIVYGTVMMDGRVEDSQNPGSFIRNATPGNHHNIWIQDGSGPWSGLDVFHLNGETSAGPTTPIDMLDLVAGDSIKVTGVIEEFNAESEIFPLTVEIVGTGKKITPIARTVGEFNDANKVYNAVTGEQWEGMYVEFTNLTVIGVTAGRFIDVADANGNVINVSDRFVAQQPASQGGNFVAPAIGTVYDTLRGVITHGRPTQDGYQLFPFLESDFVKGQVVPPTIDAIARNPLSPTSSEDVNFTVSISDNGTVTSAELFYAVGASSTNFFSVSLTGSGTTFTGAIPNTAYSSGDVVKYYVTATDNDGLTTSLPAVPGGADPFFFPVNDAGIDIVAVQFTPFENGNSAFDNETVTVTGVVTASAQPGDLGYVYIQQPGETSWAGLSLFGNPNLIDLNRGDMVEVTGAIEENFGLTRMAVSSVNVMSTGNELPAPVEINADNWGSANFQLNEEFENMLVEIKNPNGGPVYVVNTGLGFGEFRVGNNPFDANSGVRLLAGRQSGTNFTSINFSFITDSTYIFNDGIIDVNETPVYILSDLDSVCSIVGMMSYSFSNYKVFPRNNDDIPSFIAPDGSWKQAYNGMNFTSDFTRADCGESYYIGLDVTPAFEGSDVRVYPNPARYYLNVSYDLTTPQEGVVEVRDLMGRAVMSQRFNGKTGLVELNTSTLAPATYVVVIRTGDAVIAQNKVVVTK